MSNELIAQYFTVDQHERYQLDNKEQDPSNIAIVQMQVSPDHFIGLGPEQW